MSSERSRTLPDVAATHALAAEVAARLRPGDVVALVGELGAGKTEFVRGLAAALGVPAADGVCSPSYLLLNLHAGGRPPLAHFDAYFMQGADDIERAGLPELLAQGWVAAVEWADRVPGSLPAGAVWIRLATGATPDSRIAEFGRPRPQAAASPAASRPPARPATDDPS